MSFFILKVSSDFPPQSKAKLNFLPGVTRPGVVQHSYCFDLITQHSPVGLHHAFVLASLPLLRQAKHASGPLHLLCLPFPPLPQPFSREPITLSFIFFKSLIEHQLPPSSFFYPLSPYLLYFSPWNNTAWHTKYFLVYLFIGCLFFNIYLCIWLQRVSVAAHGTFNLCCSMKDLFFKVSACKIFSCGIQTLSCSKWDLTCLTRDQTRAPCIGSMES